MTVQPLAPRGGKRVAGDGVSDPLCSINSKVLSIRRQLDRAWQVQRDWRDDRIAELEAELAKKDAIIAEQDRCIAALETQVAQLLEQLGPKLAQLSQAAIN